MVTVGFAVLRMADMSFLFESADYGRYGVEMRLGVIRTGLQFS